MPQPGSKPRIAIIGGTGYGGAELCRLLLAHPGVELSRVTSIDHVDEPLEAVHLNLHRTGLCFRNIPPREAAQGVDVVFLALPHKVSATLAPELAEVSARVIDLSGDFRLRDRDAYARFYGGAHPHPEHLGGFVYGLPELHREAIAKARRVASPGCFATTIALGLLPLAAAGLLRGPIHTVAATGSSGSGAYAQPGTHHPLRANNLKIYKALQHQHTPEIEQTLGDACARGGHEASVSLQFVPVSAPLPRGILANSFVQLPPEVDAARVDSLYREFYEGAAFVRLLGTERQAEVVAIKGSMWADVSWTVGEVVAGQRQLVVTSALDNLVKGGAGQAVQSMNLMLGLPETLGIDAPALWP
ncbi:N-acetyl-gamma-glutamyl-phosphate reductase [Paraliomyxa miuraensis]|uniref:N-acetyl-gamma-glutamyl-phosphate reductase n=1 Tax=Paraliomyxa miuraensis TaxID=376150 RepID=UPI002256040D|nr:N-acetyl-gamma-glutamyl-phosphate reductase [Paraliomyxa miuraensis]MCX4239362.1 N-acetyl-gamma-glutamyl-phosphate reductase [Paraliomyxa miuraensis]